MSEASVSAQRRLGPILLAPGVAPIQILVYLVVVIGCAWADSFMNLMQPLILVQQLGIPAGQIGKIAGLLGTTQQFATLLLVNPADAWADNVGRRTLLIIALSGFALCFLVFPLVSMVGALFVLRFAWGMSFTGFTAGGATKVMDYPDNRSRGKFISLVLVTQGALNAAFISGFGSKLPGWFKSAGATPYQAGFGAFYVVAAIIFAIALVAVFCMADDSRRTGDGTREATNFRGLLASSREVLDAAKGNPKLALILLIGFIIRSDTVVVSSFLGLWIVSAGRQIGIDPITATKTTGVMMGILWTSNFVSPIVFGIVADKMDRVKLLIFGMVMTVIAFTSFGLIHDPFGWWMLVPVLLVGVADGAQRISAQSLIAQESPPHLRGATMGIFAFVGIISVMAINLVGGILFDSFSFSAPFVMEGGITFVFLLLALRQLQKHRRLRRRAAAGVPA